ncbi:hypothetical protein [Paenibacillus sp. HB172176]|uniref:hypothetical protein n=1 Tax=Paenibacillus sp. HB172176 TaxID=2493690 RepID=UPI0014399459|nr:hypothetical protein [Paenibacillus sp. HB172176]
MLKKVIFLIMFSLVLFISSCSNVSNTTGIYVVLSKKQTLNDFSIIINDLGKNPEQFELTLDNENTWNLIKENELYRITFDHKPNKKSGDLKTIFPADT